MEIEVEADDVNTERPLGVLQRMRNFFVSPEKMQEQPDQDDERNSAISDQVTVQLDTISPFNSMLVTPEKQPRSEKKLSVLDELESYWQQHDALSIQSQNFGIMQKQAQDMMLLTNSDKKRAGAFCIGI